jgi:hypothetical protein
MPPWTSTHHLDIITMMRTTLTLDPDVAARLERMREERGWGLKEAVNEVLRRGLHALDDPPARAEGYTTPAAALGGCLLGTLDDVAEALGHAEGDDFV